MRGEARDGQAAVRASGRVIETGLPFHVRCRVFVLDRGWTRREPGTEVWQAQ